MSTNQNSDGTSETIANPDDDFSRNVNLQTLDSCLDEAAKDWSQYVKIDTSNHDVAIQDLSEDLMIRLDEFDQLLSMSKDETGFCLFKQMPAIQEKFHELEDVFEKIDQLRLMINRIKSDMDKLDKELTETEATIETGSLQSFVPSIIGGAKHLIGSSAAGVLMKNSLTESSHTPSSSGLDSSATYEPINIFSTEEFFVQPLN